MTARFLADNMGAGDQRRRTIIRNAKFQPLVRLPPHQEAKQAIGTFLRGSCTDAEGLADVAVELRERSAKDDFEPTTLDNNAHYIEHVYKVLDVPEANRLSLGTLPPILLNGTKVTLDICFRLRRVTKTNVTMRGLAALRYTKGKRLAPAVAAWQSALLWGHLAQDDDEEERAHRRIRRHSIPSTQGAQNHTSRHPRSTPHHRRHLGAHRTTTQRHHLNVNCGASHAHNLR